MKKVTVAKFGGTSVADFAAMMNSATIVRNNPDTRLVVISACSGVTNILVELANGVTDVDRRSALIKQLTRIHFAILEQLSPCTETAIKVSELIDNIAFLSESAAQHTHDQLSDQMVACGELLSTFVFTHLMIDLGMPAVRFDVRDVMRTNSHFGQAEPNLEAIQTLSAQYLFPLLKDQVVVTQGFIGADNHNYTTTLGRGGSDYSAALLAEAIDAETLEIWTDVPGIYSTDPRVAPNAMPIAEISFKEASEMANFGAKILHPATLIPAMRKQVPVFVGSSKEPHRGGTWIRQAANTEPIFRAIALRSNQALVTLNNIHSVHNSGFLAQVFAILAKHNVSVDLMTTSDGCLSLTLNQATTRGGLPQLPFEVEQELSLLCQVKIENNLSLIALIGNKMDEKHGTCSQIFSSLEPYNLQMICYGASEHSLCFLADENSSSEIVQTLHRRIFE
ncbi:TPA: lysine-sensitive aspartokinase 3 [Photobacterium damselae]